MVSKGCLCRGRGAHMPMARKHHLQGALLCSQIATSHRLPNDKPLCATASEPSTGIVTVVLLPLLRPTICREVSPVPIPGVVDQKDLLALTQASSNTPPPPPAHELQGQAGRTTSGRGLTAWRFAAGLVLWRSSTERRYRAADQCESPARTAVGQDDV